MTREEAIKRLIKTAKDEIGYLEKGGPYTLYEKKMSAGGKNYTKYNYEMNRIEPEVMDYPAHWCDAFVDWCFMDTFGIDLARKMLGGFDDYTPYSFQKFIDNDAWHQNPEVGDQIFFQNAEGKICHTGIVIKVTFDTVYTIEGNTKSSNDEPFPNDGCVREKAYRIDDKKIAGYGRPKYELVVD